MENVDKLAEALSVAQGKMQGASKDSTNPHFKSSYADLASVTDAVRSGLAGTGLSYVQMIRDCSNGVAIETVIFHASGQSLETGVVRVPVAKADAQGFGSAMTYARRYSLASAFGIAPEDDDGNAATKSAPKPIASVPRSEFENLPMSKQVTLKECAERPLTLCEAKDYDAAYDAIDELGLDGDDKVAMWSLFGSAHRAGLKKIGDARRAALPRAAEAA